MSQIEMAKLAEQAERYNDMAQYMAGLIKMSGKLTDEERNLFSVAYKNVVGARRSSWRAIKGKTPESEIEASLIVNYLEEIEKELEGRSEEVLKLVAQLLDSAETSDDALDAKVFYLKMRGDYYRYLVEISTNAALRQDRMENSWEAYQEGTTAAQELPPTHPIRLGLALNFSVFYYEIQNDSKTACDMARQAFDNAIAELDQLKDESYKDSTLIMQLLRDNLTLWTSETE